MPPKYEGTCINKDVLVPSCCIHHSVWFVYIPAYYDTQLSIHTHTQTHTHTHRHRLESEYTRMSDLI